MADLGAIGTGTSVHASGGGTPSGGSSGIGSAVKIVLSAVYTFLVGSSANATFPDYAILLSEGFGMERDPLVSRTPMEDGFMKQAEFGSVGLVTRTVKYGFRSSSQYLDFIAWHRVVIKNGALWFNWLDPVDGVVKQARIVGGKIAREEPDDPMLTWWTLTFSIETRAF
jgi:hypothetical protein